MSTPLMLIKNLCVVNLIIDLSLNLDLQFIRWLRCQIFGQTPYAEAVEILRPYMENYIT